MKRRCNLFFAISFVEMVTCDLRGIRLLAHYQFEGSNPNQDSSGNSHLVASLSQPETRGCCVLNGGSANFASSFSQHYYAPTDICSDHSNHFFFVIGWDRMANRIRDDEDPSMQSNAGGSCCAHRAQYAQQEVQEALQEKILEILKNYLDGKNVNIESLRQLDHGTKMGQKEFLRLFRSCTSLIQTEQEYWILLDQISKLDKKIRNMELKKSKKTTVRSYKTDESSGKQERDMIFDNELHKLKQAREEKEHMFFTLLQNMKGKTGPVGESPVHICFLLGLTEMGKKILENHHQDINVTYQNDLLPLQLDKNESWTLRENENDSKRELGLHTGESLLHIAIVNEDTATVEYLLDKGIKISSTATGAFFNPGGFVLASQT
jgi:hypothetical protein